MCPMVARVGDPTSHGGPLSPGPGSADVFVGAKPAWRALPAGPNPVAAAKALGDTKKAVAEKELKIAMEDGNPWKIRMAIRRLKEAEAEAAATMTGAIKASPADQHACPVSSPQAHGLGVVLVGSTTVSINDLAATLQGDMVVEAAGGPNPIAAGCPTVLIDDIPY
ncbi:MAG TPA: PAAR domain-containing protein [Candidatus Sumerlaeota bacterium]|nr:PAAR domain-containing protein [Candidatus Sumerlaeota bacterium]